MARGPRLATWSSSPCRRWAGSDPEREEACKVGTAKLSPTRVGAGEELAKEREAVDVEHLGQRTQEKQKERQRKEEKEKAITSLGMHKEKTERARPRRSCQRSDIVEG